MSVFDIYQLSSDGMEVLWYALPWQVVALVVLLPFFLCYVCLEVASEYYYYGHSFTMDNMFR